jgi:hypothetical protein
MRIAKALKKLEAEQKRYEKLRQELVAINWIKEKDAVDKVVDLLFESNKLLALYRRDYKLFLEGVQQEWCDCPGFCTGECNYEDDSKKL